MQTPLHTPLQRSLRSPSQRLCVLTGGPGTGKSTTLDELARRGYTVLPEAARAVIDEQRRAGSPYVPWTTDDADYAHFQSLIVERQLAQERAAPEGLVFLDRGLPDVIPFYEGRGIVPPPIVTAPGRYEQVFLLEPLPPEHYRTDAVRRETVEEARALQQTHRDAYTCLGYEPVVVPSLVAGRLLSPGERADYLLACCSERIVSSRVL